MIQKFYSKLSEKEKKVFYIASGIVILALFDMLFLRPVTSKLKDIDIEILTRENDIKRDLRFLSYQPRIMKEKEVISSYYQGEIKNPDQIKAEFLQKIEKLATEAKVNLNKLAPSGEKEKKGYISYYAELDCTAALENIVKFIHSMDSTHELLKVVKVTMNGGKPGAKEVSVSMTIVKIILDPKAVMSNKELFQQEGRGEADAEQNISDMQNLNAVKPAEKAENMKPGEAPKENTSQLWKKIKSQLSPKGGQGEGQEEAQEQ